MIHYCGLQQIIVYGCALDNGVVSLLFIGVTRGRSDVEHHEEEEEEDASGKEWN